MEKYESVTHGMIPSVKLVQGENLRSWARTLPSMQDITNDIMPERKSDDEAAGMSSIRAALKEFNCAILPVVAAGDDGQIRAWMHVISYLVRDKKYEKQAQVDQEQCSRYIEDVLRNFEVRFEFVRSDTDPSGFQVMLLTNW